MIHERAVLLERRRRGKHDLRRSREQRREQVLGDERCRRFPVRVQRRFEVFLHGVAADEPHGRDVLANHIRERDHRTLEVVQHRFDALAIGALLGADRELRGLDRVALYVLRVAVVFTDDGHRAEYEASGLRVARERQREEERFLHREERREYDRELRGRFEFLLQERRNLRPRRGAEAAVELDQRLREALAGVGVVVAVPAVVAHPEALRLRLLVLPRPKAIDDVFVRIRVRGTSGAASGTYAVRRLQIPDALFVEEVLAAQRPDGAEIDDVAGQFVLQRPTGEDVDFLVVPATHDGKFRRAADLAREPHAPRTHDAAIREQRDFRTEFRLVRRRILVVHHSRFGAAVLEAVILELALAGFIAHGAIERVVDEQAFERVGLGLLRAFAGLAALRVIRGVVQLLERGFALVVLAGDDHRAVFHGSLAAGHDLRLHHDRAVRLALADFDETHPARRDDRERLVVAITGNEDAGAIRGLDAVQLPGPDLDWRIVHENSWHEAES